MERSLVANTRQLIIGRAASNGRRRDRGNRTVERGRGRLASTSRFPPKQRVQKGGPVPIPLALPCCRVVTRDRIIKNLHRLKCVDRRLSMPYFEILATGKTRHWGRPDMRTPGLKRVLVVYKKRGHFMLCLNDLCLLIFDSLYSLHVDKQRRDDKLSY